MGLNASSKFTPGNISSLLSRVATGAVNGVTNAGNDMLAIEQSFTPVRTGHLRNSETCEVTQTETNAQANVGPRDVDYDVFVEFGTVHMAAQPFARPAMDEIAGKAAGIVGDAIKAVI